MTTPLLSEPLEGPVFLRSSEHKLPDLVAALHNRAIADFTGHNGKVFNTEPVLQAKCPKKGKARHKRHHRALHQLRAAW